MLSINYPKPTYTHTDNLQFYGDFVCPEMQEHPFPAAVAKSRYITVLAVSQLELFMSLTRAVRCTGVCTDA